MKRTRLLSAAALSVPLLLASCSTVDEMSKTRSTVSDHAATTSKMIDDAQGGATIVAGQVFMHQHQFAGGTALLNLHGSALPANTRKITIDSYGAELSLREIGTEVTAQTHIPVDVNDSLPASSSARANTQAGSVTAASCRIPVNTAHQDLDQFQDELATACDITWKYDAKTRRLKWEQYETVAYSFVSPPTKDTLSSIMTSTGTAPTTSSGANGSNSSSSSGSNGGNTGQSLNQVTQFAAENLDAWDALKRLLTPFATPGVVDVAAPHQMVVVTAKHSAQDKIKELIGQLQRKHLQNVTFKIDIHDVEEVNTVDLGTSLTTLYNNLQGQYLLSGASPASLASQATGAGSFGVTIQNNTVTGKNNKLATSNAAVQALQNLGHVSNGKTFIVQTIEGKPTGQTFARQVYYFSGSSASQNTSSVLSGVQEQSLTIGLTVQMIPNVLPNGEIVLQYNFGLSSLNGLNPTPQGNGQTLDAPDINVQSSMQHAVLASGESLLLLGYEQKQLNLTDQGIPDLASGLFGFFAGSKTLNNTHNMLAIVITPYLREDMVAGQ